MKYTIGKEARLPAYLQLYRQVRDDIVGGIYPYNGKLPSKRILAGELGLSVVTVEHAYSLLCDEGYVEARQRSGYFVIFRVGDGFTAAPDRPGGRPEAGVGAGADADRPAGRAGACTSASRAVDGVRAGVSGFAGRADRAGAGTGVPRPAGGAGAGTGVSRAVDGVRAGVSGFAGRADGTGAGAPPGNPALLASAVSADRVGVPTGQAAVPEFPFSVLAKAMRKVISDRAILERSPNAGLLELRLAISRYLARSRGLNAGPDQIIIGSGSEYLYGLIVELLGRGKIYGIEFPSYKKIEQVYAAGDVKYERLPLGDDGIESGALWASGADILHISPYRSFPSGVTASASKRHEYMRWAGRKGRYIVEDDFESEFSVLKKPEETLFAHTADDNVIYMNTFSQTISPSLRAGYMVLPKHLTAFFEEKLGFYSCTVPTYLQYVLTELIDSGDFERHINRVRRKKREELKKREEEKKCITT